MRGIDPKELMPYEKFIQSYIRKPINGRRQIEGSFREEGNSKIITGDDFDCIVFGKGDAEECYKGTLDYFNYTLIEGEAKRIFVSAKWAERLEEGIRD